ncbi:transporter [Micromonospora sp. CPCC 205711]|uniref:transporter n=1 Tax=Micromonospora sp. CPCC 205547 TaxID=3122400 RepID=UPI002FF3FC61
MIWLAWRQHRRQALVTLLGFAVLAAVMIPIGLSMRHTFADLGLPECVRQLSRTDVTPATTEGCEATFRRFTNRYGSLNLVAVLLLVLPMLVGLFWGAPLVAREVEQGTHRFAWTQGIGRRHWALVKFGLVGALTVGAAVCYGLGMSWWVSPLTQAAGEGRFGFIVFDLQGIAPIGYTLFAVALGIFAGTFWGRMLPAMTVTLVGFIGVRAAVAILVRPHYQPARTLTFPVEGTGPAQRHRGDWVLASGVRSADGKMVAADSQIQCAPPGQGPRERVCGADLGLGPGAYNWRLYQPADRFWLFQGIETGIFVALAALLLFLALRRIRRIA